MAHENSVSFIIDHSLPIWETIYKLNPWLPTNLEEAYKDKLFRTFISYETFDTLINTISGNSIMLNSFIASNSDIEFKNFYYLEHSSLPSIFSDANTSKSKDKDDIPYDTFPNEIKQSSNLLVKVFNQEKARSYDPAHNDLFTYCHSQYVQYVNDHTYNQSNKNGLDFKTVYFHLTDPSTEEKKHTINALNKIKLSNSNFKTNFPSIFSSVSNKYIYATYSSICLDNTIETYSLDVLNFEPESDYFTKFSKQDLEKMESINGKTKTTNLSSQDIYYSFIDASNCHSIPSSSFIKIDSNLIPVSHQLCIKDANAYNMPIFKYELLFSIASLLNEYIPHITYNYSLRSYSDFFLSSLSSFNQYFDYNSSCYEEHSSLNFKGILYSDPLVPSYLNIKDASNVYYLDPYVSVKPLNSIIKEFYKFYDSKVLYGAGFNDPIFVGLFKSNTSLMPIDLPIAIIDSEETFNQNLSKYSVGYIPHLDIPLTFTSTAIRSIIHKESESHQGPIQLSLFNFINIYVKNLNCIILDLYYWLKYNTSNRISSMFSLDADLKRRLVTIENKIKMKKYSKTKEAQFYLDLVSSYSFRKNDSIFCRKNETLTADIFSERLDYIFGDLKECSDSESFNTSEESLSILGLIELFILTVENENFRQFFFMTVISPEQIVCLGKWAKNNQDFIKKICTFLHICKLEVKDILNYIDKVTYLYVQMSKSIEIANESPFQILFPTEIPNKNRSNSSLSLSIPNFYNQVSSYGSTLEYKEIFFLIDFYNKLQELYSISDQTEFNKQIAFYFPDLADTMSNRSNLEIYLNKVLGSIAAYSPARQLLLNTKANKDYLFSHFLPEHETFYSIERQVNVNGINIVNRPPINRCWSLYSIYKQNKLKSYTHTNSSCFKELSEKQLQSIEEYSSTYYSNISEISNLDETHSFLSLYCSLYNQINSLTFPKLELKKWKSTYDKSNLESYNTNLFTLLYCLCQFNPDLVSEYLTNFKVGFTKYNSQLLICLSSEDFNKFLSYNKQICDSNNFNEKANFLNNFFNLVNNLFIIQSSDKKISVFNEVFDFKNRSKLKHKSFYSLITNSSWFEFSENLNTLLDIILNFNTSLNLQIYNESELKSIEVLTVEVSEFTPDNFLNFFTEKDANLFLFKRNKEDFYFSNFFNLPYKEYESLINFFLAIDKATSTIWQTSSPHNTNLTIEPINNLYQFTNLMSGKAIFDSKFNLDFKPSPLFQTMDSIVSKHEVNIASKATNELHFLYFSSIFKNKSLDSISLFNYYEDIFNFGTKEDYKNGYIQSTRELKKSNSLQSLLDVNFDINSFFFTNPTFLSTSIEFGIYSSIDSSFYNDEHYNCKIEEKSNGALLNKTFYENINYSSFKNRNSKLYFDNKSFYDSSLIEKFSNNKEKYKANFILQANNFSNIHDDINRVYISDSLDSQKNINNNTLRLLNKFSMFLWMLISPVTPEKRSLIESRIFGDSAPAVLPFCSTPFASYINYSFLNFTYSSLENITFSIENKDEAMRSIIEVISYFKFASLFLHTVKDDKFLYTLFSCKDDSVFNSSNISYLISSYRQYIEFKVQNLDRAEYLTKANGIHIKFYNEETQSFIGIKTSSLRHLIKTIINDPYTPIDYAQIKLLLC